MKAAVRTSFFLVMCLAAAGPSRAEPAPVAIQWEVRNRFRLFTDERDFQRAVALHAKRTVLEAEQVAGRQDGEGWARHVGRLCFDAIRGRTVEDCRRDGVTEKYINPVSHPVRLWIEGFADAECEWLFQSGPETARKITSCKDGADHRFKWRKVNTASVVARRGGLVVAKSDPTPVAVTDLLVVGMGDSIAAGEGNPTKAMQLHGYSGFCYRRPGGGRFYLPARMAEGLPHDCDVEAPTDEQRAAFDASAATWMHAPCHASLYGYQARAALALAIKEPKQAVTFVPLACSGAKIDEGVIIAAGGKGAQTARERPWTKDARGRLVRAERFVETQVSRLRGILTNGPGRPHADVILLTIGANDVGFAKLVGDVMIAGDDERSLLKSQILSPADSERILNGSLPGAFRLLRRQLGPLVNGDMGRVIFTTYANPASGPAGACASSRRGFDAHPGFAVSGEKTNATSRYVERGLVPKLKALATCEAGACPSAQAMQYVDDHRAEFTGRGFCAVSANDPAFDSCFRDGGSFKEALSGIMACGQSARQFEPYAPRQRWVRTVNDSYLLAGTYPADISALSIRLDPADLHDKVWGLAAPVMGGAIHPTAEGHAAMADAVLPSLLRAKPHPAAMRTR